MGKETETMKNTKTKKRHKWAGTEIFSVLPGSDMAQTPGDDGGHGLLGGCVIDQGVTYLPARDLAFLLNLHYRGV